MEKYLNQLAGSLLKKIRLSGGYKPFWVQKVTGICESKLCKIENGQQRLDPFTLFTLSSLYDITPSGFWRIVKIEYVKKYLPK